MLQVLLKISAPLVLLLALVFLSGAASAAVSVTEKATADLCCEHDREKSSPSTGSECTDPACGCFSCSVSILFQEFLIDPSISAYRPPPWALDGSMPSGHVRSIDYPPEHLRS